MKKIRLQIKEASRPSLPPFASALGLILVAVLLSPVACPAAGTQRTSIVSSKIEGQASLQMPGTPVQLPRAPVLVLSCEGDYLRPLGSEDQEVSYTFTLYNQTKAVLAAVAISDRFDLANFQEAFVFKMRPHELRIVRAVFDSSMALTKIQWAVHPTFFLCGSGPDQGADGTIYRFESLFLSDSHITHLVLLTGSSGNKPVTPYVTLSASQLNSGISVGVPIQPDAHLELPSYRPGVPGKNLLPVVVTACSIKGGRAFATLYNQTSDTVRVARVIIDASNNSYAASTPNLQPFELRQISFELPNNSRQNPLGKPNVVFCSPSL